MFARFLTILTVLCAATTPLSAGEPRALAPGGVTVVLGLPADGGAGFVVNLARAGGELIYFQSPDMKDVQSVRAAAAAAGKPGLRIFAARGPWDALHLAESLAGTVHVNSPADATPRDEVMRVLHPGGTAALGDAKIAKPFPDGVDDWSHPQHGPDNNPLSTDQVALAPYMTRFLAEPMFSPMPSMTVAAGGRIFKMFGHLAFRDNQNDLLNTVMAINGFNGAVLWRRPLTEGFEIHRNTVIATPNTLYLGDDKSCKLLDARTGKLKREIVVPAGISDGGVWKWMGLEGGTLFALVGAAEVKAKRQTTNRSGLGHWSWKPFGAPNFADPRTGIGFGRTILAVDPDTGKVLWDYREKEYLDGRAICMKNGKIFAYSPGKALLCLDAATGTVLWRSSDAALLDAIGPVVKKAPQPHTGFATQIYIYCSNDYVFFAGPQCARVVAVEAATGKLAWQTSEKIVSTRHLILRQDALYSIVTGDSSGANSSILDYATGKALGKLPNRWNCVRVTANADSMFSRSVFGAGTWRYDFKTKRKELISPMRPGCTDGVVTADGLLHWGPWSCGACNIALYGHIALATAPKLAASDPTDADRLEPGPAGPRGVQPLPVAENDWPMFRGDLAHSSTTALPLPDKATIAWKSEPILSGRPTAPVVAGGLIFVADRSGAVRAVSAETGKPIWSARTGGAIAYPPTVAKGRVYAGSADGWVYAWEAATGRRLWRFRAAPVERRIPVYGTIASTWPVAGGVLVTDGVVYAAAGIADYDGTHVYALDAVTGKLKWHNGTSGRHPRSFTCGISLQGPLFIADNKLMFRGGATYWQGEYDIATGKCVTKRLTWPNVNSRTVFAAWYADYASLRMSRLLPDGRTLTADDISVSLVPPLPPEEMKKPRNRRMKMKPLWRTRVMATAHIVAPNGLLVAAAAGSAVRNKPVLTRVNFPDGKLTWTVPLPAAPVLHGLAIDSAGRMIVTLKDGSLVCIRAAQ
jgi:outer membrane protein assembly factor BamB